MQGKLISSGTIVRIFPVKSNKHVNYSRKTIAFAYLVSSGELVLINRSNTIVNTASARCEGDVRAKRRDGMHGCMPDRCLPASLACQQILTCSRLHAYPGNFKVTRIFIANIRSRASIRPDYFVGESTERLHCWEASPAFLSHALSGWLGWSRENIIFLSFF